MTEKIAPKNPATTKNTKATTQDMDGGKMSTTTLLVAGRTRWLDCLRCLAIVCVILYHSAHGFFRNNYGGAVGFVIGAYVCISILCVPLFFMISGYLFLNPEKNVTIKKILTRYVPHMVVAFWFWSFVYALISSHGFKNGFWNTFIHGEQVLWFISFIIACYLLTPILREVVKNKKATVYILCVLFVTGFVMPIVTPLTLFGGFLPELMFTLVFWFIAGWFFGTQDFNKKSRICIYVLGVVGLISSTVLTAIFTHIEHTAAMGYFGYVSPISAPFVIAVFVWARRKHMADAPQIQPQKTVPQSNGVGWKFIHAFARCAFGIYLIHILVHRGLNYIGFSADLNMNPVFGIWVFAFVVTVICFAIVYPLTKIPFIKRWLV